MVRIRAERIGTDTTLSRIGRMVADAQTGKAPIQRLVDRIAGIFVPVVLVIAAVTFGAWLLVGGSVEQAMVAAVSVLVIACPCALGLATPTALVAGTGSAARAGILIRDIEALERAHGVTMVVFDKTGTLTEGAPALVAIHAEGIGDAEVLALAGAAQRGSEHPLGRAMLAAAEARGLQLAEAEDFVATAGEGIAATVRGHAIRVGRASFAGAPPESLAAKAATLEATGATVTWVAVDGGTVALMAFADAPRPDAAEAVATLQARGLSVMLLSGDAQAPAARLAKMLGIDRVMAGVRPEGKTDAIRALIAKGHRVAMVGDGVNDAPALAAADVGVAMGSGADVAREAAGITLMRARPMLVPAALDIAAATARTIRQNLAFAFLYNVVCIPVAALGLLSPAVAGAAMALSSISVVANALRLKRWRARGAQ
jgi:Cu+-exporting ATPase